MSPMVTDTFPLKHFELFFWPGFCMWEFVFGIFFFYFHFFPWLCCVRPDNDSVFIPLFRQCLDMIVWRQEHEWRLHILLTNIVWKSYRWRWGHSSITTVIHWIGCAILSDGGRQRYSTNYYINRNTKRKGWTWWFTYVLKRKEKE